MKYIHFKNGECWYKEYNKSNFSNKEIRLELVLKKGLFGTDRIYLLKTKL